MWPDPPTCNNVHGHIYVGFRLRRAARPQNFDVYAYPHSDCFQQVRFSLSCGFHSATWSPGEGRMMWLVVLFCFTCLKIALKSGLTYLNECVRSHFGRPSVLNLLHYFVCSFSRCFLTNTFWSKLVHGRAIRGCFRMTVLIVHTFMDIAVQSFSSSDCTISCESASVLRSLWI